MRSEKRLTITVRPVPRLFRPLMRRLGWKGWASCWRTVYLMPELWLVCACGRGMRLYCWSQRLVRHEAEHVLQMEREGRLRMMWRYAVELVRNGYTFNRYEVEARRAEFSPLPEWVRLEWKS